MYLCRTLLCAYVHSTSSGAGADPVVDSPGSQELDNEQVPEHEKRKMRKEARELRSGGISALRSGARPCRKVKLSQALGGARACCCSGSSEPLTLPTHWALFSGVKLLRR